MDPRIETFTLRVLCPCHAPMSCAVYVRCIVGEDGSIILSQSNGCDHMSGAQICKRCSDFVSCYLHHPEAVVDSFPDFKVLK